MSSFRSPDLLERRNHAATVKKVMLEKFRAARQEPAFEQQRLKRTAVNEARAFRAAERGAAKKVREAELAAQARRAAELAAQAHREAEKAEALAKAQAAERDAAGSGAKSRARCPLCSTQDRKKDPAARVLAAFGSRVTVLVDPRQTANHRS
jgi:hypothetical protein